MRVFRERLADFDLRRPASKLDYNRRLFRAVAPRYGAVTRLLSFGLDDLWKRFDAGAGHLALALWSAAVLHAWADCHRVTF